MSPWNEEDEAILKKGLKSYHKFNDEKRIGKLFLDLGFRKTSQQIQDRIRELETGTGAGPSGGVTVLQKEDMLQFLPEPIPNSKNRKGLLDEHAGAGLTLGLPNPPNPVSETSNVDNKSIEEAAIFLDTVATSLSEHTEDMLQFLIEPIPDPKKGKGLLDEHEGLEHAGAGLTVGLPNPPHPVSETLNVDRKSVEEAAILLDTVAKSLSKQTRELAENATKLECVRENLAAFFKK